VNLRELTKEELFITIKEVEEYVLNIAQKTKNLIGKSQINYELFFRQDEKLRWFLIPEDVESYLNESDLKIKEMKEKELCIQFNLKEHKFTLYESEIKENIKNIIADNKVEFKTEDDSDFIPLMAEMGIEKNKLTNKKEKNILFPE